jgi:hypothetical protein
MRHISLVCLLLMFFSITFTAQASTIQLPQTGQTVCYDAGYAPTACTNTTGQDANVLAGKPWPNPRFTDNHNGTVTDNLTGLIWLKNASCFGVQDWQTALNSANTLVGNNTQCSTAPDGFLNDGSVVGDWRLPNITELESLVDAQRVGPSLPTGHPFSNVLGVLYWSASTSAYGTNYARLVSMSGGGVEGIGKFNHYCVWPVRGGQ